MKLGRFFPFLEWRKHITVQTLRADVFAGLTGAFIVLPQGVAFAMIAGLPSEYGLYTAIVTPIVAALFGSSFHLISGPTTAISILVFNTISPIAEPGTPEFIRLALTLTFLAGIYQLCFGLAKLGMLINFVSHSVVVGFTAGAAVLIATGQLRHALGLHIPGGASFIQTWAYLLQGLDLINGYELSVAIVTLITAAVLKTWRPRLPGLLFAMIIGSLLSLAMGGESHGVRLLGRLPARLPPLSSPDFSLDTIRQLAPGALAVALLGLIEALSIARSIAMLSGQHINGNQEFIGQGLSNIIGSFFSSYAGSGSFTRSGINYESGAVTPISGICSALFLAVILLAIAPLTAYLPLSAMGGVILMVAFRLIDVHHIREIVRSSRSETFVLITTFAITLFFELEFAIYTGVLLSLTLYLNRTSHPRITVLAPDPGEPRRRFTNIRRKPLAECPQLTIIRIDGSLFFGAVSHVAETLANLDENHPKHLLIVGGSINFIDVSGAMMLTQEISRRRQLGKDVYLCRLHHDVYQFLERGGFIDLIQDAHIFSTEFAAISKIVAALDASICRTCQAKIFDECNSLN